MKKKLGLFFLCSSIFLASKVSVTIHKDSQDKREKIKLQELSKDAEFNEQEFTEKRKLASKKLVNRAIDYFKKNKLSVALHAFSHDKNFRDGELYLFVYNKSGVCLAHGEDPHLIWRDLYDYRSVFGSYIVRRILERAKLGGGFLSYEWKNVAKVSYVKEVDKEGEKYVVGTGFYSISKRNAAVELVRSAAEIFKGNVKRGLPVAIIFAEMSYPLGRFVYGDLYLFALGFDGEIMAQGDVPGLIGQNAFSRPENQAIINKLKGADDAVWLEYISKKARKVTYAEKVKDDKGREYFIACGYYPEVGRKEVADLLSRGYVYMQRHGVEAASNAFSDKRSDEFRYGDLWIFVYDYQGKCIAHGGNPDFVGSNGWHEKDDDGKYFVQAFIQKAKDGGGWVDYKEKNSFRFVYIEDIKVGVDYYAIGCGLYPSEKPEAMQLLVKSAESFLKDVSKEKAFGEFVKKEGKFVKGDLELFVFDDKGICYVYGDEFNIIWKNLFDLKDDDGRPFVKLFINTAKQGGGRVIYKVNGKTKSAFVVEVKKGAKTFVVGSSCYL